MKETGWDLADYIIAAALVSVLVTAVVFIAKKTTTRRSRLVAIAVAVVVFVLIWAELGVGLFGTPVAGD